MNVTGKDLLIIIPAFNEENTIRSTINGLVSAGITETADILIINDASKDRTKEIVESMGVPCVTHVYNLGYGAGLHTGYKYAVNHGYEYIIQMDADGQHDVKNIPVIYSALKSEVDGQKPDIVLGSRFMDSESEYDAGLLKNIAFVWFRFIIKLITGKKIMDPTTGLQGLSRSAFGFYSGYNHFDDRYPDANMILQMLLLGFSINQVPAVMHKRAYGKSMHSGIIKPVVYMMRMTLQLFSVLVRERLLKIDVKEAERFLSEPEISEEVKI